MRNLLYVAIGLLIVACFPLPYGYYTFLRIAITIISVLFIINDSANGFSTQNIIWGVLAILYNPLIPIHLTKTIWIGLNIVTAVWFGYCCTKYKE